MCNIYVRNRNINTDRNILLCRFFTIELQYNIRFITIKTASSSFIIENCATISSNAAIAANNLMPILLTIR